MKDKITLYSTNCPKCRILELKLDDAKVNYEVCSDTKEMLKKGFKSAPMLEVNDKIMTFLEANKWIKENK